MLSKNTDTDADTGTSLCGGSVSLCIFWNENLLLFLFFISIYLCVFSLHLCSSIYFHFHVNHQHYASKGLLFRFDFSHHFRFFPVCFEELHLIKGLYSYYFSSLFLVILLFLHHVVPMLLEFMIQHPGYPR
ncbi:hypothetical protein K1719_019762 [Acacia pycnantha]|nr:hypothetical protein K1719_019762 [Acacia pycnantha]